MPEDSKYKQITQDRKVLELEIARCEQDPVFFIMKYVWIQAEQGRMRFSLFDFQKKLTNLFKLDKYKRISILKSRQIGITTLCSAYALWFILFHGDKSVMCLAPKEDKATIILDKVKFAYENLPKWMQQRFPVSKKGELYFVLKNASSISAASGASDDARGFTAHLLFIDEAAFIDKMEDIWTACNSTLDTTDGTAIILSTPNGIGNWFFKKHTEGKTRKPKNKEEEKAIFTPVDLPWNLVPTRTQEWRDAKTIEMGERAAKQEYDCNFAASGDTVIDGPVIEWYEQNYMKPPKYTRGVNNELWVWQDPIPGHDYALICDVGRGDGSDNSTIEIFDIVTNEQVAEYVGMVDTDEFPKIILGLGYEYNEGMVIIERESIGWAVVKDAVQAKYSNLYFSPKEGMVMDAETYLQKNYDYDTSKMTPGFSTNVRFRPLVVNCFINLIDKKQLIVRSMRSINEWKSFIWNAQGKAVAQKGFHDDTIIPMGIYGFLRDTTIRFSKEARNLTQATLNNYVMTRAQIKSPSEPINTNNNNTTSYSNISRGGMASNRNPFLYRTGKGYDDCSWLVS